MNLAQLFIANRNMRAAFTATGLAGLLVWMFFQETGPVVSKEHINAVVTGVEYEPGGQTTSFLSLELPDKTALKLLINLKPAPKVGDTVPVIIEIYKDDKRYYSIDHRKWFDDQVIG